MSDENDQRDQRPASPPLPVLIGSAADGIHLYVVEYEYRNQQWRTVVEARDVEAAKRQFRRDNPDVEMVACY